jgi:5-methylthioadenosine/S-adenosylhomocysteine deaminase
MGNNKEIYMDSFNADIVIANAMVLTMDNKFSFYNPGALAIKGDKIIAVGKSQKILEDYKAPKVIDGTGKLLMPGLINAHTHVPMTIFRGYADDLPLHDWLYDYIFPIESEFVTRENVWIGTKLAIAEMLRSGTTTFNDMYYYVDEIARLVDETGIRAVLAEGVINFPAPNSPTPSDGLITSEELIKKWGNHPRITISFGAHSPYSCAPGLIQEAKALSDKYKVPFNIHVAETLKEFRDSLERYGMTPVAYLESLNVLDKNVIIAHGVHLTRDDIEILSEREVSVAHNPECNMKLSSGVAPIPSLMQAGVKVGLGTDGVASNNDMDMFHEMNTAALLHKLNQKDPTVMNARSVIEMATIGGARVIGLDKEIGSLETGKKADMILLDLMKPHAHPLYNIYSLIVYSLKGSDVETVIIDGKIVMQERKFSNLDIDGLYTKVEDVAAQIRERGKYIKTFNNKKH